MTIAPSGTHRRILWAFTALIATFSLASAVAIVAVLELHHTVHDVKESGVAVAATWELVAIASGRCEGSAQASPDPVGDQLDRLAAAAVVDSERSGLEELRAALASPGKECASSPEARAQHQRRVRDQATQLAALFGARVDGFANHLQAAQHTAVRNALAFLAFAIVFAIGVAFYLSRSIARPLAKLEAAAVRIGEGDLEVRLGMDRDDEFGRLAHQFEAMTARLREHQGRLIQTEKLASLGRLAAGVAHEINNPLGVIRGYTEVLLRTATGTTAEDLRIIQSEVLRCRDITEALLEISRPTGSPAQPIELVDLCRETIDRLGAQIAASSLKVVVAGSSVTRGDSGQLSQVLFNLLKNALEASREGGLVEIQIEERSGCSHLAVTDGGPGLSAETRARLFEPFFTTKDHGTGLGLAISKAIAEAHGGSLQGTSDAGGGARFTLTLPSERRGGAAS